MSWLFSTVMALQLAAAGAENPTDMEAGVEPQPSCPAGWHQNGHRCFSFYPVWATWVSAESYCSQRGGNLASVHSPDQQVFIQDLVRKHTDQPVWIGGYNVAQEGVWLWSDGSAFEDFPREEEPRYSGHKNCMELHTGGGRGWNDASCEKLRFYVCSMKTRSDVRAQSSQKRKPQIELAAGLSVYDLLWESGERVAQETLYSAFLRGMYSRRLPPKSYIDFCHQEALYLTRVISMLEMVRSVCVCVSQDLIRTMQGPEDIKLFLQGTHQLYQDSLKEYQNQVPQRLNLSSIQTSPAIRQYLQSFHDVVNEEPIYWVVSLLPRAMLRPYLAKHLPLGEQTRPGSSPCLLPWLSLFPCPCYQLPTKWNGEDHADQQIGKMQTYKSLVEKYQAVIDIYKAVNIFRVNMINEKTLFTSSWFPTGDEEAVEDQNSLLLSVESGPDLTVRL
ncbi:uncharacterized protein LOC109615082 isoform X3 [Esox lucius]|uniref:uncharacterized protein LOC109615082 isoform X3 n=1 Tax=Esox lucius TaxID=8010 RepID=UPI0014776036|nr:uncharacterized protein LOC109615082 isoform X3 [Esox lucius]XP_034146255.1 uncharacterized protein LOC109615082 isoform X3 [Esox lucius]